VSIKKNDGWTVTTVHIDGIKVKHEVRLERNVTLPLGRLRVKHAVKRGSLDTNSAFALGPRKTAENLG
jgi:hypothetical protein